MWLVYPWSVHIATYTFPGTVDTPSLNDRMRASGDYDKVGLWKWTPFSPFLSYLITNLPLTSWASLFLYLLPVNMCARHLFIWKDRILRAISAAPTSLTLRIWRKLLPCWCITNYFYGKRRDIWNTACLRGFQSILHTLPSNIIYSTIAAQVYGIITKLYSNVSGTTLFDLSHHSSSFQARSDFIARQKLGRLGTAEEIASMVVYLASTEVRCRSVSWRGKAQG